MRSLDIWLLPYLRQQTRSKLKKSVTGGLQHIIFCLVDHFEPVSMGSTIDDERRRMRAWTTGYPLLARRHWDSDGVMPQHSWFYPGEAYRAEHLDSLSELCRQGFGEIELHLHHGYDTSESLRAHIEEALHNFNKHGALITRGEPALKTYGFIHGNMALDNSMGDPRWCGVNNELDILQETGCYADFSMPTAPARSQTRKINAIYYAVDNPHAPKSHNTGRDVEVGNRHRAGLMIVQGPLALSWSHRKWGLLPHIDNGEIMAHRPATPDRVMRWVGLHIHVQARPEWVIVKVSTHGAEERHFPALLGAPADHLYTFLETQFRSGDGYRLHYVTARELFNIVKAAESGRDGDPGQYRDFLIPPYLNRPASVAQHESHHGQ
jgi:hypothetical protein